MVGENSQYPQQKAMTEANIQYRKQLAVIEQTRGTLEGLSVELKRRKLLFDSSVLLDVEVVPGDIQRGLLVARDNLQRQYKIVDDNTILVNEYRKKVGLPLI